MLILGLFHQVSSTLGLFSGRDRKKLRRIILGRPELPVSLIIIVALLLWVISLLAVGEP